jgi:deoxyribodipyrimidine photo-lyase
MRFGEAAMQEYGPYNRKRKWISRQRQHDFVSSLLHAQTGEPLIDCIMLQLMLTGFVPNRLRMVFASYLSQQNLPWRLGAFLFESWLIDYDHRSNVFNWLFSYNLTSGNQHTFSIQRQLLKFDPQGLYLKKWQSQRPLLKPLIPLIKQTAQAADHLIYS